MSVLELEAVSKRIGGRLILDNLSMSVAAGEVYGFLGPNGAGKTTTIRLIVGLARPTAGSIRILGHDIARERREAVGNLGAIVENPEVYSYLTGRQNLEHYARLAGIPNSKERILEVADIVNLRQRLDDKVKRYSLGMRQRLGVAQALLGKPRLLVLDEPTNGLDPAGMREFRELMRSLAETGVSVFVSSHLLSEIQMMCDRVAVLKEGRILAERNVEEMMTGGEHKVAVTVADGQRAVAILAQGYPGTDEKEGVVRVPCEKEQIPQLLRTLVAAEVDIYGVAPLSDTLEEAFLSLTQGVEEAGEAGV